MTEDEKTAELTEEFTGEKPKTIEGKKKKDFLELMRKRHKREVQNDHDNRDQAVEDQKFSRAGVKDQWDAQELERRKKMLRPAIVLDELSRPINQVTGEMLLNKSHAHVIPASDDASLQVAKAIKDIVHDIEYDSKADRIYNYAGRMICICAYGAWRVLTRYSEDNPFEQEIYLERIKNPLSVYMDSSAKDEYYADAKYGFVMEKVTKEEFEERFPDAEFPKSSAFKDMPGTSMELWFEESSVWIGDYYVLEPEKVTFVMLENDDVVKEDEYKEALKDWREEQEKVLEKKMELYQKVLTMASVQPGLAAQGASPSPVPPQAGSGVPLTPAAVTPGQPTPPVPPQQGAQGLPPPPPQLPPPPEMPPLPPSLIIAKNKKGKERKREIEVPKVKHYAVSCDDILEGPHDVPGEYIPIVLVHGRETNVEGKTEYESLIRKAKGPQKLLNQIETNKAEIVDMIPKAPWIAEVNQIEGLDEFYTAANIENRAVLPYKAYVKTSDSGGEFLVPKPERVNIGQTPVAVFQYAANVKSYIEDSLGIAAADTMNVPTPERTGAASRGRRKASDIGTYHFIENLSGGIEHSARIIVSMIPEVYDTERDVRTRSEDEVLSFLPINTTAGRAFSRVNEKPQRYNGIDPKELAQKAKDNPNAPYNKLSTGRYDVFVKVGPPFSTAREEASEQMITLATQGQRMNPVDKYYAVKRMDLGDGGEYAEVLKRTIPAWIMPPKEGEQRAEPPKPPQMQLLEAKTKTEQMKAMAQMANYKLRMLEIATEEADKDREGKKTDKEIRKIALDEFNKIMFPQSQKGGM